MEENRLNYGAYKITDFGDLEEYITERETVIKTLDRCDFAIIGVGRDTDGSYKYQFEIFTDNKNEIFEYSEGRGCEVLTKENGMNKIINALWCLLTDYSCVVDYSLVEFMKEFGYDSLKQGEEIYNAILENNKKLLNIFDSEEIEFLKDNIQL